MIWLVSLLATLVLGYSNIDSVNFQMLELDNPISSVHYCGNGSTILAITQSNTLYRSENEGFTWKRMTEILERQGKSGKVNTVIISDADDSSIAILGKQGSNWYSSDCGKTIKPITIGKSLDEFQFHPTDKNLALAATWTRCTDFADGPCAINKELYFTRDSGEHWKYLANYVVQFSWGHRGLNSNISNVIPKTRIYITHIGDDSAKGHQKMKGWNQDVDFSYSDDYFKSYTTVIKGGNKFLITDSFIMVAQLIDHESQAVQLMVASEQNLEKFYKSEFPMKTIPEKSYTLLDSSEGSLVLNINHSGDKALYGNIYISDSLGRRFSLSLLHNSRGFDGYSDFQKISNLEGIYIANILDVEKVKNVDPLKHRTRKETEFKKTVITFDKGGRWHPLTAPERDSEGKKIICEDEDCSLHLNSITDSTFGPFYSTTNAVGLILGTGNVGKYLSKREDEINTYLSRDGGLTWYEIMKGSHMYEMGDHGALIVMADDQNPTNTLLISRNEGLTWDTIKFSDSYIEVDNIIIQPGSTTQNFLIYGRKASKGVTVAVDFSSYIERQCQLPEDPSNPESDYELWSPNDGRTEAQCLMGRRVQYIRRKRDSECYNGEEYERNIFIENCRCTPEDYECDLGYYLDNDTCQQYPGYTREEASCASGDLYYEIPTGYRRVPGNSCIGGASSKYDPYRVYCDTQSMNKYVYMGLTVAIVIVILMVLGRTSDSINRCIGQWMSRRPMENPKGYTRDFSHVPDSMLDEEDQAELNYIKHKRGFDFLDEEDLMQISKRY